MRGTDQRNDTLFSYVRPDSRVPPNHPLRPIRRITDRPPADGPPSVVGPPSPAGPPPAPVSPPTPGPSAMTGPQLMTGPPSMTGPVPGPGLLPMDGRPPMAGPPQTSGSASSRRRRVSSASCMRTTASTSPVPWRRAARCPWCSRRSRSTAAPTSTAACGPRPTPTWPARRASILSSSCRR